MKRLVLLLGFFSLLATLSAQQAVEVREPSGYQGFIDQNSLYRLSDDGGSTVGFSTTHGFYFNGHTFIGVGIGLEHGDEFWAVPVFTALKYVFSNKKQISPSAQVRLGSYMSGNTGAYGDLSVGIRFASKRDFAVNVMLTGTYFETIKRTETHYQFDPATNTSIRVEEVNKILPSGVGVRLGIEW